jgi:hypothetical protein
LKGSKSGCFHFGTYHFRNGSSHGLAEGRSSHYGNIAETDAMPKAASTSPAAKLAMPKSIAAELDRMVAKMNTPKDRAARAAFFAASSADLGRAAMNARQPAATSKAPCPTRPKS